MSTNDSLRVCIVSKQFPPGVGGGETYAYELANGLAARGHDVDVYTEWIDSPDETVDIHENASVYRVCKARKKFVTFETLYFSYRVRRTVDFDQYDVVHGTLMPASTIAVTPFNQIDAPVVLTSHGTSIGEAKAVALETPADYLLKFFFHPMNVVMDYIASRDADTVIAISDHAREQLTTRYGLDESDVEMIPHGVDTDRFYPREERHPTVNPDKFTVLYVGRLGARKGLGLALRAIREVDDPNVEFLIAGTGRHEVRLHELAAELEIADRVRFLGYVPDDELPTLYSSADVFLLPSKYEGFGLVILEAMACGTPAIGTDTGGIPTAIGDSQGMLVDQSAEELSRVIVRLANGSRESKIEQALEHARQRSWENMIERVNDVYTRMKV